MVDEIFPVAATTVERAKSLVLAYPRLAARDAIHIAAMQECGVRRVMSFDTASDVVPGLTRLRT
jgi:predicted nucleic acid-binding protein